MCKIVMVYQETNRTMFNPLPLPYATIAFFNCKRTPSSNIQIQPEVGTNLSHRVNELATHQCYIKIGKNNQVKFLKIYWSLNVFRAF